MNVKTGGTFTTSQRQTDEGSTVPRAEGHPDRRHPRAEVAARVGNRGAAPSNTCAGKSVKAAASAAHPNRIAGCPQMGTSGFGRRAPRAPRRVERPAASSIATPHRFSTVFLQFMWIRRGRDLPGCSLTLGLEKRLSHPERDRCRVVLPADNPVVLEIHCGPAVLEFVVRECRRSSLNHDHCVFR